jgi:hypothetical protein
MVMIKFTLNHNPLTRTPTTSINAAAARRRESRDARRHRWYRHRGRDDTHLPRCAVIERRFVRTRK